MVIPHTHTHTHIRTYAIQHQEDDEKSSSHEQKHSQNTYDNQAQSCGTKNELKRNQQLIHIIIHILYICRSGIFVSKSSYFRHSSIPANIKHRRACTRLYTKRAE